MQLIDVRHDHLKIVQEIIARFAPEAEVWVFGSRAKWLARDTSDLDLCIREAEPLGFARMGALREAFEESSLPYKVDVVDWATSSPSFREIIERDKVQVQKRGWGMSSEWRTFSLEELGRVVTGKTPKTSDANNFGGTTPFVTPTDMDGRKVISSTARYLTETGASTVKNSIVPAGSVMVSCIGSDMGKSVIAGHACVSNQQINSIVVDSKFSSQFIYYNLSMRKAELQHLASGGSTMPILNKGDFSQIKVDLPPLSEQKIIAAFLSAVDDRIALLRETNATLEAIAQALFKSWVVNFDPVRAKAEGREPEGISSEIAALFPSEFEDSVLGEIPKGWQIGTLAKLATLNPESWTAKKHPATVGYIDLANAKDNEIAAVTEYLFDDAPSRARRVLRNGDTIVGTVRPGNRSYAFIHKPTENLTASTGFAVLRPIAIEDTEFVYLAATQESSLEHLAHVADGGAYPAVRPEVVAGLTCILPSKEIMHVFHETTAPLLADIAINQKQTESLAALRDTLLPRLMSGELRIADESFAA
jgi:type I restriction enzyme, S subunit